MSIFLLSPQKMNPVCCPKSAAAPKKGEMHQAAIRSENRCQQEHTLFKDLRRQDIERNNDEAKKE